MTDTLSYPTIKFFKRLEEEWHSDNPRAFYDKLMSQILITDCWEDDPDNVAEIQAILQFRDTGMAQTTVRDSVNMLMDVAEKTGTVVIIDTYKRGFSVNRKFREICKHPLRNHRNITYVKDIVLEKSLIKFATSKKTFHRANDRYFVIVPTTANEEAAVKAMAL